MVSKWKKFNEYQLEKNKKYKIKLKAGEVTQIKLAFTDMNNVLYYNDIYIPYKNGICDNTVPKYRKVNLKYIDEYTEWP